MFYNLFKYNQWNYLNLIENRLQLLQKQGMKLSKINMKFFKTTSKTMNKHV